MSKEQSLYNITNLCINFGTMFYLGAQTNKCMYRKEIFNKKNFCSFFIEIPVKLKNG